MDSPTHNLIVINESPHAAIWLYEALGFSSPGDSILLRDDAVAGLQPKLLLASFLAKCAAQKTKVYALSEDIALRGIKLSDQSVELVSVEQIPDLILSHRKQVAW